MSAHRKPPAAARHPDVPAQVQAAVAGLRSHDGSVRTSAREALARIGTQAVPAVLPLLKDPSPELRWEAAKALVALADVTAAAALVAALEDRTFGVRWLAAEGLIATGEGALATLLAALIERSHSVWLRSGAHHVLHDLARGDLKALLEPIVIALDQGEPQVGLLAPATNALNRLRIIGAGTGGG